MTILLGFAAVNTGNNLLFLTVSAMLGFMAVSGVAGWLNIRGITIGLQLPDELYCGVPTQLAVRLGNRRRLLPSFLLQVEVAGERLSLPFLLRGETVTRRFLHTFGERGTGRFDRVQLCSPFPINFFVRCLAVPVDTPYLVFPRPRPGPLPGAADGLRERGEAAARQRGFDGDLLTIADYSGTEPLKLVHWRLSARHAELKVKQLAASGSLPVLLDPALLPGTLEERLSFATYLVNRLMGENRPVGLKLGERLLEPATGRAHRLRLLGELATYGTD